MSWVEKTYAATDEVIVVRSVYMGPEPDPWSYRDTFQGLPTVFPASSLDAADEVIHKLRHSIWDVPAPDGETVPMTQAEVGFLFWLEDINAGELTREELAHNAIAVQMEVR